MEPILLKYLEHRGKEWIQVVTPFSGALNKLMRDLGGVYTHTHRSWLFGFNKEEYEKIINALQRDYKPDATDLGIHLRKEDARKGGLSTALTSDVVAKQSGLTLVKANPVARNLKSLAYIGAANKKALAAMHQHLTLKAYSESTIRTYLNEMSQLLIMLKEIPAEQLQPDHLKRYLNYCIREKRLRENTLHSRINALKFYYEQVLGRSKFFFEIPRPKRPLLLPRLLNESELARLFNALTNKKHKAMLFTAYSAGLRVSEIVNLKLADIDSKRMQILVSRGKGKKDRYVNLSPVVLDLLRRYLLEYKPRPAVYLFESEQTGTAYPARTVQQIFSNAKNKAGIKKEVGIHSLRHSFATHLLDKGTDIRYIKDLLGHFNIKTTERYLHVSKKQLVNIISPFDDLWKKENVEW